MGWFRRGASRLNDIQKEMKKIRQLKKDAAIIYFKEGTISRNAYDRLITKYDRRMGELKRQEEALKPKGLFKRKLRERAKPRKAVGAPPRDETLAYVPVPCPSCGHPNFPHVKYCAECGKPLPKKSA